MFNGGIGEHYKGDLADGYLEIDLDRDTSGDSRGIHKCGLILQFPIRAVDIIRCPSIS